MVLTLDFGTPDSALECDDASSLSMPWIVYIEGIEESKATMHRRTPRRGLSLSPL
jgi:hypothetical protein